MLWTSKDHGQVEAVVGPYKLYEHSFRILQGTEWLLDEVRKKKILTLLCLKSGFVKALKVKIWFSKPVFVPIPKFMSKRKHTWANVCLTITEYVM